MRCPAAEIRHLVRYKGICVEITLLALPGDSRGADHRGMKSFEFHRHLLRMRQCYLPVVLKNSKRPLEVRGSPWIVLRYYNDDGILPHLHYEKYFYFSQK